MQWIANFKRDMVTTDVVNDAMLDYVEFSIQAFSTQYSDITNDTLVSFSHGGVDGVSGFSLWSAKQVDFAIFKEDSAIHTVLYATSLVSAVVALVF